MSNVNENPDVPAKQARTEKDDAEGTGEAANREWIEKLQQLLSCPVCYETIRPAVDICSNGHSVCGKCRARLVQCPVCSAEFVKATNIMLAHIAEYVKYPCSNAIGGCKEVYYLRDEESHLKGCAHRVHRCKIDGCDWAGKREELRVHAELVHRDDVWKKDWCFSGLRRFEEDETSSNEFGKFLIIHNELFWMLSSYDSDEKKLYQNFQYVGPREAANAFAYQICLKSLDDRRQFLFKSTMDDDTRSGSDVFNSPNCTVIDFKVLRSFSTSSPDFRLKYHYFISRTS